MKVLVVDGSVDELREMGLGHMADRAELVIDEEGPARDRYGQTYEVERISVNRPLEVLLSCQETIKQAWEREHEDEAHLGHAAAGLWLFYWFSPQMESMSKLAREGRSDDLRRAMGDYINAGFGGKRGPTIQRPEE